MEAVAANYICFFKSFIDIVYKNIIFFAVNLIVNNRVAEMVEMGPNLVKSAGFWGDFHKGDFAVLWVGAGGEGFEFGEGGVSPGDDCLADIDPAGLVFAEPVKGLVDDPRWGWATVDEGKVGLMNFPSLLHFSQDRSLFLAPGNQEESGSLAIEPADKGEEFAGVLFPEPINQGEGSIGAGGMNQPSGWLIHNEKTCIGEDDGGRVHRLRPCPRLSRVMAGCSIGGMEPSG